MVVVVRRFDPSGEELARWEVLARDPDGAPAFLSLAAAKQAAMRPPRDADLHVGDLLAVVPAEAAAFPEEHARALYVVAPNGVKAAPSMPHMLGGWWLTQWGADGAAMVFSSRTVDKRRVVMAACDCAETVLHRVPEGENRPRIALIAARSWCRSRGSEALKKAAMSAGDAAMLATDTLTNEAASAAQACAFAAGAVGGSMQAAANAVGAAALRLPPTAENMAAGRRALAPLVERWIPLPVVLLSILGHPDAIPFDPRTA